MNTFTNNTAAIITFFFVAIMMTSSITATADCMYNSTMEIEEFQMGNLLTWSTATENNNEGFIVERSIDGRNFENVGQVEGAGNSTEVKKYRFLDASANKGAAYYRLRQLDYDGTVAYTDVIVINKKSVNNFTIFAMSTPKNNVIDMTVMATENVDFEYSVANMDGTVLFSKKQALTKGFNILNIDIASLNGGTYKVVLNGGSEQEDVTFDVPMNAANTVAQNK